MTEHLINPSTISGTEVSSDLGASAISGISDLRGSNIEPSGRDYGFGFKAESEEQLLVIDNDEVSRKSSMAGNRPTPIDTGFKTDGKFELSPMKAIQSQYPLSPRCLERRKSFTDRTFSRLGRGSLRGSIFSLSASAIGSGVLSLPYVLKLCGYVQGPLLMILGGVAAEWSLSLLAHLCTSRGLKNYSGITNAAAGPWLTNILSQSILIFMFVSCVSYQIIITSLLQYAGVQLGYSRGSLYSPWFTIPQGLLLSTFILIPISYKRDMDAFKYVSLLSIGSLLYTGIVLISEVPDYYNEYFAKAEISPAYFDLNVFQGCAMTFFSYQCQVQMLPIYSELVEPNHRRIKKVINRAILIDLTFYLTIALAGYFSQFDNTEPIVLERKRLPGKGKDYAILIAIMAVVFSILVAFPVCYNPTRQQLARLLLHTDEYSQRQNLIMTVSFVYSTMVAAILFPKVDKVIGITGGLLAPILDYVIPCYCYVKLSPNKWTHWKNLSAIIFFTLMTLIGVMAVGIISYELIMDLKMMPRIWWIGEN